MSAGNIALAMRVSRNLRWTARARSLRELLVGYTSYKARTYDDERGESSDSSLSSDNVIAIIENLAQVVNGGLLDFIDKILKQSIRCLLLQRK